MARQGGMSVAQKAKAAKSLAGMKAAAFSITGDRELIRNLEAVRDSMQRSVLKRGLSKAVRILTKSMRAQVPADLKSMKQAIGGRLIAQTKLDQFAAKAGAGVAKKTEAAKKRATAKAEKRKQSEKRGAGISAQNVHWFILGTKKRTVKKTGKNVGLMPPLASYVIKNGFAGGASNAAAVIRSEIVAELARPRKTK